jgi:hypothetical protein
MFMEVVHSAQVLIKDEARAPREWLLDLRQGQELFSSESWLATAASRGAPDYFESEDREGDR